MPRLKREFVEGGLYHVYNRFARGEAVFGDPEEAIEFVERLRDTKERDGFAVHAWCLMSNHFHLVIRTTSVPLSRTMHFLQNGFSRDFNRRWCRTGPLWQTRYKAKLIDVEVYLAQAIIYVHLNPVRAGLVENPLNYTLSGHRELMGRIRRPLCDVDASLMSFGTTERSARKAYTRSLKTAMKEEGFGEDVGGLPWWKPERELKFNNERSEVDHLGRSTGLEREHLEADQFVGLACELIRFEKSRLRSRRQDSETARIRRLIAACGIERWGQRAGELGAALSKHPVVVSRWVREASEIRRNDSEFAAEIDKLDHALSKTVKEKLFEIRQSG